MALTNITIRVERSATGKWPGLYHTLSGAHSADELLPLSLGGIDLYGCKVMAWSHTLNTATFEILAQPWSIIERGIPGEAVTRTR
jgi:hypothetical protein